MDPVPSPTKETKMKAIDKLPTRRYAHPFDRSVRMEGDRETHGVDYSPNAIGGSYGIGWREAFRCHRTGQPGRFKDCFVPGSCRILAMTRKTSVALARDL